MPVALSSFFVGLAMGGKGRGAVDLLRGDVKRTYFKYLGAAFGSAMLAAVYSLVDMAMVGQYQGPDGAAALDRALTRAYDGLDLTDPAGPLTVRPGEPPQPSDILVGKRVGIDYAGEAADFPWRFWVEL